MLRNLWNDDFGGVISAEYALVTSVVVMGSIPGLVAVRDASTRAAIATVAPLELASPDPVALRAVVYPTVTAREAVTVTPVTVRVMAIPSP